MKHLIDNNKIMIFGYGSLLSEQSLKKTAPDSKIISNGILKNYLRIFNKPTKNEFVAALNLVENEGNIVNGVVIELDRKDIFNLLKREFRYNMKLIKIQTSQGDIEAYTFVYQQEEEREFMYESKEQAEYVEVCIQGAKERGIDFYENFMKTTFVEKKVNLNQYYDKNNRSN
ncbi:MAG: gamma-glutamylcyclotransferase family protein [Candidatus Woesearchaeota archaeon]